MKSRYLWLLLTIWLARVPTLLLSQDKQFSVSFSGSFTTTSKLYYFPRDPDEVIRNQYLEISDVLGLGFDLRKEIGENVLIGINVEYLNGSQPIFVQDTTGIISVKDGFIAFPFEATGYFRIPFSSTTLSMYIGGGGGVYTGERQYSYGGVKALPVERNIGFGIHVLCGFEYSLSNIVSLRSEMKFREVQFESTNAFPPAGYNSLSPAVTQDDTPFASRISIDGILLTLGLVYKF